MCSDVNRGRCIVARALLRMCDGRNMAARAVCAIVADTAALTRLDASEIDIPAVLGHLHSR